MKVLIVCSGNRLPLNPFITEQVQSLNKIGIETDFFLIKGKGLFGYLKNLSNLKKKIKQFSPDILHAYYGFCGLLSCMQTRTPVVVSYVGSDINSTSSYRFSKFSIRLAKKNIFVSRSLMDKTSGKNSIVIPLGIDTELFVPQNKKESRLKMNLSDNKKYILFSSSFNIAVKNYSLAKKAIEKLNDPKIELIELKGFTRDQVETLMNAVDVALMTSLNEGSPQFIKEAMACNVPIVSTDVGDVKEVIGQTQGCYITDFTAADVSQKLLSALEFKGPTNGRENIKHLEIGNIAQQILRVYKEVLNKK